MESDPQSDFNTPNRAVTEPSIEAPRHEEVQHEYKNIEEKLKNKQAIVQESLADMKMHASESRVQSAADSAFRERINTPEAVQPQAAYQYANV